MKKIFGTIILFFGFLEIVVLSAISTFDKVEYTDSNHFVGFMSAYDLWVFLIGAGIMVCLGFLFLIFEKK